MNKKIPNSRTGRKYFLFLTLCALSLILSANFVYGQMTGEIAGRVYDLENNDWLPGANILLEGTTQGASSDRDGFFRIVNVKPGTYQIKVMYVGYEDFSAEVTVSEGVKRVIQDIAMKSAYLRGEEILVLGERQGQAKALNIQRTAESIKNVVSEEQILRFPDLNTAEVIQRLPGISIERDQGEARYVLIRGTEPRLSTTTINGEKLATPEDEGRFVGLDVISSNQLAAVEVTKALTPDMDGDAIGGSVNLITKSAFDYDRQVLNVTLGGGYGALRGRASSEGDLTWANRFGKEKNIGITLSGSFNKFNRGDDNNEMEWGNVDDVNDNEIPWALQTLELRDYWKVARDRYGVSGAVEYRMDQHNQFFVNGMYNYRKDTEWRNGMSVNVDKGDYNNATSISGATIDRALRDRVENQIIYSFTAGGKHELDKLGIDYRVAYTYGREEKPDEFSHAFELDEDVDLTLDLSDTDVPKYKITNLSNGYELDAANYTLDEIEWSDQLSTDENKIAVLNLKYPFMMGRNQGEFKVGGKAYMKDKKDENKTIVYGWEGDDDVLMSRFVHKDKNDGYMDNEYDIGFLPDGDKLKDFFDANKDNLLEGEFDHEDADPSNYEAKENIYASYAMASVNFGKALLLGGVRYEMTSTDYTGYTVSYDEDGDYESTEAVTNDDSYAHILPSLHLRYSLTPRANIRAAYSRTIARPNFYDLVPYNIVLREDEELVKGNPDLLTTTSNNIDLLGEYYMKGIGIISGGFFYKSMKDIIYLSVYEQEGGSFDGYEVEQPINGESASLIGVEVNWQQQFTFLPGIWNGFGIYANYTYTDSKAELPERDDAILPGQAGNMANLALSYEKYGFQGRLSMAYFGKHIFAVGETEDEDVYYDGNLRFDFNASQQITRNLQVFLQAVNLNNTPLRYYIGDTKRPIQREFYSWWMQAGIKFSL